MSPVSVAAFDSTSNLFVDGDDLLGDPSNLDEVTYLLQSLTPIVLVPAPTVALLVGSFFVAPMMIGRRRRIA